MESTIYDVSRLSGVSIATVSRTFSNPEKVRKSTREKVMNAAEALHYYPNAIARALAGQKTDKIAFIICKKDATILDEFYARICEGILNEANRLHYQLVISTMDDWIRNHTMAKSNQIGGVILAGSASADFVNDLQNQNVSIVLVNHYMPGYDLPCVVSDERMGVTSLVDYLAAAGHRRIAMLAARVAPYVYGERYSAFMDAMRAHGLTVSSEDVVMCDATLKDSTDASELLLGKESRPTAVFCTNDLAAAGVFRAARRLGISIPDGLSVVGYDDSSICKILDPELTSIRINCYTMGETSVRILDAVLNGQPADRMTTIPVELRVRKSS